MRISRSTAAFLPDLWRQPIVDLARALIGARLLVDSVGGTIVETEAYDATDPASHSHGGPTKRNAAMFGPVGHAYVYRIYGLHWCLNLVGGEAPGAAVLIRALAPTDGIEAMIARRGTTKALCAGPGRLAQALAITGSLDGASLDRPPFLLEPASAAAPILTGPRIGITEAADRPWRFGLAGSPHLSRAFPAPCDKA